jgi:hypothetical protein
MCSEQALSVKKSLGSVKKPELTGGDRGPGVPSEQ